MADREAEELITAELVARIPGVVVVGEEASYANPKLLDQLASAEIGYVIDPIDGTANFVQGSPKYAVMAAEVRKGQTTRSWIWQPELDLAYVAELGAGATCNGQRLLRGAAQTPPRGGATRRGSQQFELTDFAELTLNPNRSAGFDYPQLIEGSFDFFVYRRPMPWDHLPGSLLLAESGGGRTIDVHGNPYGPSYEAGTGIIISAASDELAQLIAARWRGPEQPAES